MYIGSSFFWKTAAGHETLSLFPAPRENNRMNALKPRTGKPGRGARESNPLANENLYRSLFDQATEGILLLDGSGRIVDVNRSFAGMHGYQVDEVSRMNLQDLACSEDAQLLPGRIQCALGGKSLRLKMRHRHRNQSILTLDVTLNPLRFQHSIYVLAFYRCRTDPEAAEKPARSAAGSSCCEAQEPRTMHGIVPICAGCKSIRDDRGNWQQVEVYVRDHTEAQFSHGICPDCFQKLYGHLGDFT